jgi:hypothetical protein
VTEDKARKRAIRARMSKTGERYTAARRHVEPSTHDHTARYWRQRTRVPSWADVRQSAWARPSQAPASRPATRSG